MFGLPMFDMNHASGAFSEVKKAREAFPTTTSR
ncbi:MAG: ribulose bisphosphate carboxylase small subunit [Actinobacteria bacterium]|nr:ribulose bisphosphate carboxylase small subunit [Actinomycetota bacterium]